MKRKIYISLCLVAVILGLGLYWFFIQKQPEKYRGPKEKITLAAYAGETAALVYIAQEYGFFAKNGLEVTIKDYESGKAACDALIAGEADISTSADFVFVINSFDHSDLRVFGTVANFETKELVARKDKGITKTDDLKGKKIGVTKKTSAEFSLASFLIDNGFFIDDVELVDLKPPEIVEAIVNGDIDAGYTWDPYVYNMKQALGDNAISWPGPSDFYFLVLTKKAWLENHPGLAQRFLRALLEAEDYTKENSLKCKEFIRKRFNYTLDYTDSSWPKQKFAVVLEQAMLTLFENQARWRIGHGLTQAREVPNYLDYIYRDALKEVRPEAVTIIE